MKSDVINLKINRKKPVAETNLVLLILLAEGEKIFYLQKPIEYDKASVLVNFFLCFGTHQN